MAERENHNILNESRYTWLISILVLFSVICFSIETLPDLSETTKQLLGFFELIIVILFTIEYVIRLILTPNRLKFIFSFYGLIDLMAILPFYLSFAVVDLRALRLLRLLSLVQLLKLTRYNAAFDRFIKAISMAKEELIIYTFVSAIILYLAALGIYFFEHQIQPEAFTSIFDCLWWSVATLTTVGYGDIYPVTVGGRIFTFVVLFVGLGMVAVPTGIISSSLSIVRKQDVI